MSLTALILYFGLPIALQSILLFLLFRKRVGRSYPWFVTYTAFSVAATLARLSTIRNPGLYYYVYWGAEMVYALLALLALFEIFHSMFRYYLRIGWFRPLFPLAVLVTIVVAVLQTTASPNNPQDQPMTVAALAITFGVRLIQGACFVCLWLLVWLTGVRWRQPALGIITGFGLYASYALVTSLLRWEIGIQLNDWVISGLPLAYIFTLLLWLWFFFSPQPQDPELDAFPPLNREELHRYVAVIRRVRRL